MMTEDRPFLIGRWRHVSMEACQVTQQEWTGTRYQEWTTITRWDAHFDGPLTKAGETVYTAQLSASGATADEARLALEKAFEDQGWRIRI